MKGRSLLSLALWTNPDIGQYLTTVIRSVCAFMCTTHVNMMLFDLKF